MDAVRSFETAVFTKATRRSIPEDGIFHENYLRNFFPVISMTIANMILLLT
jgi:hypothetical protein